MRVPPCPPPAELLRAFSEGAPASLRAHLESCRACATEWGRMGELRALAKKLPARIPDAGQREQLRAELLARLELPPPRGQEPRVPARWVWAGGLAAAAACVVVLLRLWSADGSHPRSASASFRATVQSHGPAVRFVHERHGGDELVLLTSGQLLIEVAPLQPGERFRVRCRDAEVEVRGTAFEVDAAADHLLGVRVLHGRVEVRPSGGRMLLLGAGERWLAGPPPTAEPTAAPSLPPAPGAPVAAPALSTASTASPVSPASPASAVSGFLQALSAAHGAPKRPAPHREPAAAPVRTAAATVSAGSRPAVVASPAAAAGPKPRSGAVPGERAAPRTPTASVAERAFDEGWAALQRGEFGAAADAFGRIDSLAGSESLVEDARFWRAVALGRAGRLGAEADALGRFLSLHPGSARAGEASAILGWLLLKQGRLDEAAQRFQAAALDSRDEIRKSARAGLTALAARRPPAPAVAP
ncbi:MAG: FecR domain-containing protein [Polyangia bacterium]